MASWYDSNYKFRAPMTLHPTSGGTLDFSIIVPPTMAIFWDNILATAVDLRVCDSDGITLLTFDRNNFSYANKTLTIEIDNYAPVIVSAFPSVIWIYWGYASAADAATVFAPVGAELGRIALEAPPAAYRIVCGPEPAGATKPRNTITKNSTETIYIYWDVTELLAKRQDASAQSMVFEGASQVSAASVLVAGVDQAAMHTNIGVGPASVVRCIEYQGRVYLRTDVIGGADATDYTLELKATTIMNRASSTVYDSRTITNRALLMVRDVSEV